MNMREKLKEFFDELNGAADELTETGAEIIVDDIDNLKKNGKIIPSIKSTFEAVSVDKSKKSKVPQKPIDKMRLFFYSSIKKSLMEIKENVDEKLEEKVNEMKTFTDETSISELTKANISALKLKNKSENIKEKIEVVENKEQEILDKVVLEPIEENTKKELAEDVKEIIADNKVEEIKEETDEDKFNKVINSIKEAYELSASEIFEKAKQQSLIELEKAQAKAKDNISRFLINYTNEMVSIKEKFDNALSEQNTKWNNKYNLLDQSTKKTISENQATISNLETKNSSLEEIIKQKDEQIKSEEDKNNENLSQIANLTVEIDTKEKEISSRDSEIERLNNEIARLKVIENDFNVISNTLKRFTSPEPEEQANKTL